MVKTCPYGESYLMGLIQNGNCIRRDNPLYFLKQITGYFYSKYLVSYHEIRKVRAIDLFYIMTAIQIDWNGEVILLYVFKVSSFISARVIWSVQSAWCNSLMFCYMFNMIRYTGWFKKKLDTTLEIYFWDWV